MADKIKDQYGDTISVNVSYVDGSVMLTAVESGITTPGKAALVLSNKQRKQLRRALKRRSLSNAQSIK